MTAGDGPSSGDETEVGASDPNDTDGTSTGTGDDRPPAESDTDGDDDAGAVDEGDGGADTVAADDGRADEVTGQGDAASVTDAPADHGRSDDGRPDPVAGTTADGADPEGNVFVRFWRADSGPLMVAREFLTSAAAVAVVGLILFGISGVWPPMVAVESGSMEPHMSRGDLVFITEPGRYSPAAAVDGTGIVTHRTGEDTDYRTFGEYGSVVVYDNPERFGPPIIHRAMFHVEEGENWYDKADPRYMDAESCDDLRYCPAPYAGFITKGDANPQYDQVSRISGPVRTEWVTGIARVRVPYLGYVRLGFSTVGAVDAPPTGPVPVETDTVETNATDVDSGVTEPADEAVTATRTESKLSASSTFTTVDCSGNGGVVAGGGSGAEVGPESGAVGVESGAVGVAAAA
jgi:signal peptidase